LDSQPFKIEWISDVLEMSLSPSSGTDVMITVVQLTTSITDDGDGEFSKH
jgi:hypothetical protein